MLRETSVALASNRSELNPVARVASVKYDTFSEHPFAEVLRSVYVMDILTFTLCVCVYVRQRERKKVFRLLIFTFQNRNAHSAQEGINIRGCA